MQSKNESATPEAKNATWRIGLKIYQSNHEPFVVSGPNQLFLPFGLTEIQRRIRDNYTVRDGRVGLWMSRDGEEFYTLAPVWGESGEDFVSKCAERIQEFCNKHQIPLQA